MAITQNTYTGNGSTVLFSFTFPYLETTDVKVTVNGTPTTAYTFANATTIQFNTAPVAGAAIRIYRDTDDASLAATFYSGSAIRAKDLNDNFTQNLYVTQEVNNNAFNVDGSNPMVGPLNMNGFQIDNLAAPTSNTDAVTKQYVDNIAISGLPNIIPSANVVLTQAGTGAVQRTVESKLQDVVSVKDFGAVGDGVTDDTNAFQLAGDEANGGLVYVPPGSYNITSAVTSSSQFFLEPTAVIPNQYRISAKLVDAADRDYEAMMGMGYFNIWLTGTSFSNPASGSFIATLWRLFYDGTPGTFVVDQAGGPFSVGATNGLRWNQTVAGSGGTYRTIEYRVEDATVYNNGKATLSFFLTAGTGSFPVTAEVVQFFGSGGSPSADVVCGSQAFTATTTTTRFSLTVDMPSTGSKTFGNNIDDCVKIRFYLPNNATFNCVFNEVKFERGPIMTPFSHIPLSIQQSFVDRYLQYTIVSIGFNATAAGQYMYAGIPYKTEMRRVPDRTWSGGSSANLDASLSGGRPATTSVQKYGATAFIFSAAAGASFSINQLLQLDARL